LEDAYLRDADLGGAKIKITQEKELLKAIGIIVEE